MEMLGNVATGLYKSLFNVQMGCALAVIIAIFARDIWAKGWKQSFTHKVISSVGASVVIMIINVLFAPFVYFAVDWIRAGYDLVGIPGIETTFWAGVPFVLAGILAVVLHDFADYWNHRFMHMELLWPVHAIHHSDEDVNGFTTFRVHFLEAIVMKTSYILIVSWAGFSAEAASFGAIFLLMHNIYVHANLEWDHGPFKLLLASPRFHRWHHANEPVAFGKNLANIMPFWDYAFGTYYNPHVCHSKMGADGVPHSDVVQLMLYPLTEWTKMFKKAAAKPKQSAPAEFVEPGE